MSKTFRVHNSRWDMCCCGSSLAECVGLTFISSKETSRGFDRALFPAIKSWEK